MKVDSALLERYHLNQCTPQERAWVEEWLLNEEVDELEFHSDEDKSLVKNDIWAALQHTLPEEVPITVKLQKSSVYYMWKGAVAASLVFGLSILAWYAFNRHEKPVEFMAFNNPSALHVNHVNSSAYNLAIGTETFAKINEQSGVIDLSGSILISPKKDISLHFDGAAKEILLKEGQTYIILNTKSGSHGFIVINERNLINLPPVIQKKLIREFDI